MAFLPGDSLVRAYYRFHKYKRITPLAAYFALAKRWWSVISGADVPLSASIGPGLWLPHPNGVVVHPSTIIGANCTLMQQVTLGLGGRVPGAPILEDGVLVGAGAKIIGGVRIGVNARIGANAVVTCDVPAGYSAVGVPARILPPGRESDYDPLLLRAQRLAS